MAEILDHDPGKSPIASWPQLLVSVESSAACLRDRRVGEVEPLLEQTDAQYAREPDRRMEFSERTAR